jgi:hypothetical protein
LSALWEHGWDSSRTHVFLAADTGTRYVESAFSRHAEAHAMDAIRPREIESLADLIVPTTRKAGRDHCAWNCGFADRIRSRRGVRSGAFRVVRHECVRLNHTTRLPGASVTYRNYDPLLQVGESFGACAFQAGAAGGRAEEGVLPPVRRTCGPASVMPPLPGCWRSVRVPRLR